MDQASTETNLSGLLKQGALMEVDKEPGKTLLAVVRKRDGKKNWIAEDQVESCSRSTCVKMYFLSCTRCGSKGALV